ncbi:MAG: glycosyltransferase [Lachnospiraceae bacterium]|nr:glycosyltransferase [Lachnospiraceae bacterium]
MKAVHFTTVDFAGAYRAAERISQSLRSVGVDSEVVVRSKSNAESDCTWYFGNPVSKVVSKAKNVFNMTVSKGPVDTVLFGTDISSSSYVKEADVIFLHWVNSFLSYDSVKKLAATGKKIIWVMHDMWPYTGGCHLNFGCERFSEGCGKCPQIKSTDANDISAKNVIRKREAFIRDNISFVTVSRWMADNASKSTILQGQDINVINNPINTDVFCPGDHASDFETNSGSNDQPADNRKIILFGAHNATTDPNKGFKYLAEALGKLDGSRYRLICFGNGPSEPKITVPGMEIEYKGLINNDNDLIDLYRNADVVVIPSLMESFGYTCLEAMACGTPAVSFDTTGLRDQIVHKENGYMAAYKDSEDLAKGIEFCAENKGILSAAARRHAVENSSYEVAGNKYRELCLK